MRAESINRRLLLLGVERLKERGAEVHELELRQLGMPLFDQDFEDEINAGDQPMPKGITAFRDALRAADGFLIASPEHNGAMSAALKNAIDWASRDRTGGVPLVCFAGKAAALLGASPGKLGGIRGLPDLRRVLSGIGTTVIASDFACGGVPMEASSEWPDDGVRTSVNRVADGLLAQLGVRAG